MDLDPTVLARLRRGDARALAPCYEAFGARVHRLCRLMLRRGEDAEDATQEVFLKVLERASQFSGRARFSTWLHRLTVNHCLNRLEREALRRADPLLEGELAAGDRPTPLESAVRREDRSSLEALLQRLTPDHRAVVVLRELEELSYAEIAQVVGVPVGTVMSRLSRARERLVALAGLAAGGRPAHGADPRRPEVGAPAPDSRPSQAS